MYKRRTILEVQDWGDKWQVVFIVEHVPEPGDKDQQVWAEQAGHCFPKDTLEWRAAEYGLNPADTTTLLDIVLAEPFLTPADHLPGESLHDAPTIEAARTAHVARCAQAKLRGRVSTRAAALKAAGGVLDPILTTSPMSAEALSLKKEFTERARREFASRIREPEDRIKKLREAIGERKESRG